MRRLNIHRVTYFSSRYGNGEHVMSGDEEEKERHGGGRELGKLTHQVLPNLNGLHDNHLHYSSHLYVMCARCHFCPVSAYLLFRDLEALLSETPQRGFCIQLRKKR